MQKPHALCLPFPTQGHITPMMHLAKLLHSRGFHITFVNTEFNHNRLIKSGALDPTVQMEGFLFETFPDGLQTPEMDETQNIMELVNSVLKHCLAPFRELVLRVNEEEGVERGLPVTCLVRDGGMAFAQKVADELDIPDVALWTMSAASLMCIFHFQELIRRGYIPFKDSSQFSNGYLDTRIDWMPSMPDDIRLKDMTTFLRTTDPDDTMLNVCLKEMQTANKASAVILNTFKELEGEIIDATPMACKLTRPPYAVGPLLELHPQLPENKLNSIKSNLWQEEMECLEWLDRHDPVSVVYINFGSIVILTPEQINEFAWGLANSNHSFLWVIRPDLVSGESAVLEPLFLEKIKEKGLLVSWCPQKQVLSHRSVGAFLTHCGWNSTLESICSGVPMLCWPFAADQMTNCRYTCNEWGIGVEIENNFTRDEVEVVVREMMEKEMGKEMRKKAMEWKERARKATEVGGSSHSSFDRLVNDLLVMKR